MRLFSLQVGIIFFQQGINHLDKIFSSPLDLATKESTCPLSIQQNPYHILKALVAMFALKHFQERYPRDRTLLRQILSQINLSIFFKFVARIFYIIHPYIPLQITHMYNFTCIMSLPFFRGLFGGYELGLSLRLIRRTTVRDCIYSPPSKEPKVNTIMIHLYYGFYGVSSQQHL